MLTTHQCIGNFTKLVKLPYGQHLLAQRFGMRGVGPQIRPSSILFS